jgi:hypothetical protein
MLHATVNRLALLYTRASGEISTREAGNQNDRDIQARSGLNNNLPGHSEQINPALRSLCLGMAPSITNSPPRGGDVEMGAASILASRKPVSGKASSANDIATILAPLYKTSNLAKILSTAEKYLAENVSAQTNKYGFLTLALTHPAGSPQTLPRNSTPNRSTKGNIPVQGCRILDMWLFSRKYLLRPREAQKISWIKRVQSLPARGRSTGFPTQPY